MGGVAGKVTDVHNDVAQCLTLRPQPLRMTTGPEGPAAGRREGAERPTPGALCQKRPQKERDSRERMRGRNTGEGEGQAREPESPVR